MIFKLKSDMNRVAIIAFVAGFALGLGSLPCFGQRAELEQSGGEVVLQGAGLSAGLGLREIEEFFSSENFADRQRAMQLIGENPERTSDAVQRAAQSQNPEVAGRAKWILQGWRNGFLFGKGDGAGHPGMSGSYLGSLLDQGHFDALMFVLEVTVDPQRLTQVRKQLGVLILTRFAACVQIAIDSERLSDLVKLIDVIADTREMALCRLQLLQLMGADLEAWGLLPESANAWTPQERDETMVLLLYQTGEIDEAIARARLLLNRQVLVACQILASRWTELADDAMAVVNDSEAGSKDWVQAWSHILTAAERSENQELRGKAIEALSDVVFDESDEVRGIRWRSLAMHGQLDRAFAILDQHDPHFAAEISLASSRPMHAFKVLGYPLELVDTDYSQWVEQALKAQAAYRKSNRRITGSMDPQFDRLVQLVRCLDAVGHDGVAYSIAKQVCQTQDLELTGDLRPQLFFRLSSVTRSEWTEDLLLAGNSRKWGSTERYLLAESLDDCDAATLAMLTEAVQKLGKFETLPEQISYVSQIAQGLNPSDLNVDEVLELMVADIFRRLDRVQADNRTPVAFNANVHDVLLLHGNYRLASSYLERFVEAGNVDAILQIAEEELSVGSMSKAEKWFTQIEKMTRETGSTLRNQRSMNSFGQLDFATAKALVGRWTSARRVGDSERTSALKKKLDAMLCSPSLRFRLEMADYLREKGEIALSRNIYQGMVPITALTIDEKGNAYSNVNLYDVMRKYVTAIREEQPAEAARLFDIALLGMVDSSRYRASAYVTLPILIQEWLLEAAIDEQDNAKVAQSLKRILELNPLDISFAEEQLPKMREVGMQELADDTLDQIMDVGVLHAQRFSRDAMTCNNVAWVAAKNERRLEDALKLATLAVSAEPDSATYRDTLAEVLFLMGRTQEALHIEKACLLDDPGQWHLHEQIEKYTKAIEP